MSNYFSGPERLEVFSQTGAPMRMGDLSNLTVPDYQVLRNLVRENKWDDATAYLNIFHAQNVGMNSLLFDWCMAMTNRYAELTSSEQEKNLRPKAIKDFHHVMDSLKKTFSGGGDSTMIEGMKNYFTVDNLRSQTSANLIAGMEADLKELMASFNAKNATQALALIEKFHHHAVIRHDTLIAFTYSYPSTCMEASGEKIAVDVGNGSMLKNPIWNGLWELTKVLTPTDLAAFLAEHLRYHFSGDKREGQTQIVEDDKRIRLVFDPCGSGGALRQRLGKDIKTLKEKHDLGWNKCGEVNLYCTHCALNERHSIDLFGYPKLVVEFQADPMKPCGWTMYKNEKDVPKEVYERLGLTKK